MNDLALGRLHQSGLHAQRVSRLSVSDLGGVRIDGLISHAFLRKYAWTLDFDARRYTFSPTVAR